MQVTLPSSVGERRGEKTHCYRRAEERVLSERWRPEVEGDGGEAEREDEREKERRQ